MALCLHKTKLGYSVIQEREIRSLSLGTVSLHSRTRRRVNTSLNRPRNAIACVGARRRTHRVCGSPSPDTSRVWEPVAGHIACVGARRRTHRVCGSPSPDTHNDDISQHDSAKGTRRRCADRAKSLLRSSSPNDNRTTAQTPQREPRTFLRPLELSISVERR